MIESVQARHRGAYDFESHYDNLCALQDSVPLPAVKAHLSSGILDINADRVRATDWLPILNTLQINKSLEYVAVRSFFQPQTENNEKRAAIMKRKTPAIRSKEITFRLCKALRDCLNVTPSLMYIELQGLPLRDRDLQSLVKGIMKNNTVVHLSLEYCRVGDSGLEILCKGLKNNTRVNSVNLTGCCLSARGAELIAKIIKNQGMRRHTEAWRDSLRYGQPDLDKMQGIRRININNNPLVGNQGAQILAEALKDDLWIKALDMQGAGMSTAGAKAFLDVLKYNTTLVVLDLRRNPLIDRTMLHSVMEQLMINCNGQETEYQWIEPEPEPDEKQTVKQQKPRRKQTKVLNHSVGKKTTIKISPTNARRHSRSASALVVSRPTVLESMKPAPGLPWRTAARANRFRGFPPEHTPRRPNDDISENDTTSILITHEDNYVDHSLDTFSENKQMNNSSLPFEKKSMDKDIREINVELEQLRRSLREERIGRAKADQKVMQLMLENKRLEDDLRIAKLLRGQGGSTGLRKDTTSLQDESVLESIEVSFKKFHAFLDMLREAGLGELITMAGLDQDQMPFSANRTFIKSDIEIPATLPASVANSFRLATEKDPLGGGDRLFNPASSLFHSMDPNLFITHRRIALDKHVQVMSKTPKKKNDVQHPMNHINESAYLAKKQEADAVYERLLQQTSGTFTSSFDAAGVNSTSGIGPRLQPNVPFASSNISAVPKERSGVPLSESKPLIQDISPGDEVAVSFDAASDRPSPVCIGPIAAQGGDNLLFDSQEMPNREPPTAPEHHLLHVEEERKKGDRDKGELSEADRRIPSQASEANYSMDSFEQSYFTEHGEVVVLGDNADLLVQSTDLVNFDSDESF